MVKADMQSNDINVVIFWVCVAIGTAVYAAIIWSLVAYRKSKKQGTSFHKSTATEIAWTVIPLLIIIAMTIPAAKLLSRIYNADNSDPVGITFEQSKQWHQVFLPVN
jgi:cytochrome c oxidase subunit 2